MVSLLARASCSPSLIRHQLCGVCNVIRDLFPDTEFADSPRATFRHPHRGFVCWWRGVLRRIDDSRVRGLTRVTFRHPLRGFVCWWRGLLRRIDDPRVRGLTRATFRHPLRGFVCW
jgi:hypothetical protein